MTTNPERVQTFKILIIGESGVGKTSLMTRFVYDIFRNQFNATIGVDFQIGIVHVDDYKCRLQIWDTAGQERFRAITNSYYRGADGVIIVYDVTDIQSFTNAKDRFSEIQEMCEVDVPMILIGNKNDADNETNKQVSTRVGQQYAEHNNLQFFEVSVKDNKNVCEIFQAIAKLVLNRRLKQLTSLDEENDGRKFLPTKPFAPGRKTKCCNT